CCRRITGYIRERPILPGDLWRSETRGSWTSKWFGGPIPKDRYSLGGRQRCALFKERGRPLSRGPALLRKGRGPFRPAAYQHGERRVLPEKLRRNGPGLPRASRRPSAHGGDRRTMQSSVGIR